MLLLSFSLPLNLSFSFPLLQSAYLGTGLSQALLSHTHAQVKV